jgi:hypothetical protein
MPFLSHLEHEERRYLEVRGLTRRLPDPPWRPTFILEPGERAPRLTAEGWKLLAEEIQVVVERWLASGRTRFRR